MSQLSNLYLFLYNSLQFFGWALALFRVLSSFVLTNSTRGAYASAGELICFLQAVEFLEVIHGAIDLVPSGTLLPLMQWAGRAHFVFAIVRGITEVQELPSIFITFLAWSLSEIIRYPYYALSCLGRCPSWITYLRYTAFIVLYPVGMAPGEMWPMYQALPYIKEKQLYGDFFLGLPISYYNIVQAVLLCYPFLWLKLYMHLLKQRKSKLSKLHEKKKT